MNGDLLHRLEVLNVGGEEHQHHQCQERREFPSMNESSAAPGSRRRPWVAFVAAMLAPGLGHLYVGETRAWIAVVAIEITAATVAAWLFVTPFGSWSPIALASALVVVFWIGPPAHAARLAHRGFQPILKSRWLRLALYVFYFFVFGQLATSANSWIRHNVAEPFREPTTSMFPSLWIGDHFFADTSASAKTNLKRGDIIIFTLVREGDHVFPADQRPDLPRDRFVKRIIGLPGDSIEFRGRIVVLNDVPLPQDSLGEMESASGKPVDVLREVLDGRSYTIAWSPDHPAGDFPRSVVPPGRLFVVGDNRNASFDSRFWGTVRQEEVVGVATHIYYSRDPHGGQIRWSRIGRVIQ